MLDPTGHTPSRYVRLQTRTCGVHGDWEATFRRCYPELRVFPKPAA
jgi:hypothetical protein